MKAIIIDDEINAIKSLRWEIEHYVPEVKVVETFESARDAITYLDTYLELHQTPHLVFLDIEMPQMNGFDFIKHFPERNFEIIFTTAYSDFALEAIKNEAVDYLLKPIDSDDLSHAVEKAKKRINHEDFSQKIQDTLQKFNGSANISKIKINYGGKIDFVEPHEIVYIASEGNYCRIYFENKKEILITSKLKDINKELPAKHFFRSHKSYIINVNKITSYYKNQQFIMLNNTIDIPLARARKKEFIETYF